VLNDDYRQTRKYRMRWWTLLVLSLSLIIIGLDNTILNVAIPTIQTELDASASERQWMVDSYVLVFAGLLLTMGALGDRFGRKLTLQIGLVIFGISSILAAYSTTSEQLIITRAVMGVGGALIMPSTLSIITDVFPREERGKAIGIWAGTAAFGIGIGPALGGWLVEQFWWGSVFLINGPIVLIALVAGYFLVPRSRDPIPPRIDIPGAILSITALVALVFAIIEAPARGWLDPVVLGAFGLSLVLGAMFIWQELRSDHPMLNLNFFRNPRFSAGAGAISTAFFSMFGVIFILTQYLQFVQGYSALEAGVRISPFAVGMMVGAANSHRLVRKFGTNKVVSGGMILLAAMLASFALWDIGTAYLVILGSIVLMSFGMANTMAPSTDAVMGAVPLAKAGVGSAMNDTTRMVGGALGVAIIGSILNSIYSSNMANAIAQLPPDAAEAAKDSVGAAIAIGSTFGGPRGEALAAAARQEFVDAMGIAFIAAAAVAFVGALAVLKFMPAGHLGSQQSTTASGEDIQAGSANAPVDEESKESDDGSAS
jgi:EmrB/QacA subfamily drug resistance transporter